MKFFDGIQWLLMWMAIYVILCVALDVKKVDPSGLRNLGCMVIAWLVTVLAMVARTKV